MPSRRRARAPEAEYDIEETLTPSERDWTFPSAFQARSMPSIDVALPASEYSIEFAGAPNQLSRPVVAS